MNINKVVFITFRFEESAGGGAVAVVRYLVRALHLLNVEVVVITTHPNKKPIIEYEKNLTIYRFLPLNLYWIGDKFNQPKWKKIIWQTFDIYNFHAYKVVREIITKEKPNIAHVHKLRGLSPAVWNAARDAGLTTIVHTCHDYELISPQGLLRGYRGNLVNIESLWLQPYIRFRRNYSNLVRSVTAPSQYALDAHLSHSFFQNATKKVIPNSHGYYLDELEAIKEKAKINSRTRNSQKTIKALYLGRLEHDKGVDNLCATIDKLSNCNHNIHLHVAGTGSLEKELRKKYSSNSAITFHGDVIGKNKTFLFEQCEFLIVPSIVPEVFGIVIVEAFAFGKPVIASRIGGIPEIVNDRETGFLVKPNSVDALYKAIINILENPEMLIPMSQHCFDAAQRFTLEGVLEEYLMIYQKLLSRQ